MPFAERHARRHVLSPFNDASPFFVDSAWPQAINQDSHPVLQTWLTIDTFDPYHGRLLVLSSPDPNQLLPPTLPMASPSGA